MNPSAAEIIFDTAGGPKLSLEHGSRVNASEEFAELSKTHPGASIYVVDDDGDQQVYGDLSQLLAGQSVSVSAFSHADEFLECSRSDTASCLIMTLDLADFDHNDFAKRLRERGACPIIFISDRNDVASAVKVMRAGAIDFLTKPIDANILLGAIRLALNYDVSARAFNAELATLQSRFSTLTPRERQVLSLVIGGMRNKQAAAALGIREVTLQVHRSQVMRKMFAHSFAELVRMSITLGISFERVPTWRAAHANMTPPTLNRGRMLAD